MSDTPKKENDKLAEPAEPKATELSEKELGDAAGGMTISHQVVGNAAIGKTLRQSVKVFRPTDVMEPEIIIKGPSWVNLMTYRKVGAASEPSANRSVSELFAELSAEETD